MDQNEIQQRLRELFATSPIVVWHDATGEFAEALSDVTLPPHTTCFVERDGERFELKALANSLGAGERLLIYRQNDQTGTHQSPDWFADVMSYAPVFTADAVSIRLADLHAHDTPKMRAALKQFAPLLKRQTGLKRVHKLRSSFSTPNELALAVMLAALRADAPATADWVLLCYIEHAYEHGTDDAHARLERAGAWGAFCHMSHDYVGFEGDAARGNELAVHLLMTTLRVPSDGRAMTLDRETELPSIDDQTAQRASEVLRLWLNLAHSGGTIRDALLSAACTAERAFDLPAQFTHLDTSTLASIAAFPTVDRTLLERALHALAAGEQPDDELQASLVQRRTSVWFEQYSSTYAALVAAHDIEAFNQTEAAGSSAADVWSAYTTSWFRMDTAYRKFRAAFRPACNEMPDCDEELHTLARHIEARYRQEYVRHTSLVWERAAASDLAAHGFAAGIPRQSDFFITEVEPLLHKTKRTWVIVSDALRYEVAAALAEELERTTQGQTRLTSMQAGFPSITSRGMAALLPHTKLQLIPHAPHMSNAQDSVQADGVGVSLGGFDVLVDGMPTQGTPARQAVLQAYLDMYHPGMTGVAMQSSTLMKMGRAERKAALNNASLVYLYHNRIDAIGDEAMTEDDVFNACSDAIDELSQLVALIVREFRAREILITADHGFLYTAQPLGDTDKVALSEVQGDVVAYGKRYVVGTHDAISPVLLPINLDAVSDGTLRGFAPREGVRIKKAGGGENYVHGGISLQELCVPVLHFTNYRTGTSGFRERSYATLSLVSPLNTITNASFELQILQNEVVGGKVLPALYELGFVLDDGTPATEIRRVAAESTETDAINRTSRVMFHVRAAVMDRTGASCRLVAHNLSDAHEEELVLARCTLSISIGMSFSSDW